MKACELCSYPARMYCEADRASLCWDCDQKVHCANFLVAKHPRSLLCHVCQSPTSWIASGPKLGHTVSVCEACVDNCRGNQERGPEGNEESQAAAGNEHEEEDDLDDDDDDDDDGSAYEDEDGEYVDGDEEDGGNQVVPWSSIPPPPPTASSSSSEVSSSRFSTGSGAISSLKRMRENADLDSEDDIGSFSSRFNHNTRAVAMSSPASENDEATSLKARRTYELNRSERVQDRRCVAESRCAVIFSSLKRLRQNMISDANNASSTILAICELSRDVSTNPNHSI